MVHRMLLAKVGDKYIHLLKMFGAFFTFGCVFNVFAAAYSLSVAVDEATAIGGDAFGSVAGPIGNLFIWLSLMVIGLALYRSDRTIIPWEDEDFCQVCGVNEPEICTVCMDEEPITSKKVSKNEK